MSITWQVFLAILETFFMFAIGAWCCRTRVLTQPVIDKMSHILIDIFMPMMIFHSIYTNYTKFGVGQIQQLWIAPLTGFLMMLFGAALSYPLAKLLRTKDHDHIVTFRHFCAINNYLFLPLVVLQNVWGDQFRPTLFLMNIGFTIAFWTIGVGLLGGSDMKRAVKNIFGVNQIAVVVAIIFALLKIPIPFFVESTFQKLGDASIPLMLVMIGGNIYLSAHKIFRNIPDALYMSAVRLILIPAITVLILKAVPLPRDVYVVAFVVSLMPVSVSSALITTKYGGSTEFAGQAIIFTTTLSLGTIPLFMQFLGNI
jgi:hypothetical protein